MEDRTFIQTYKEWTEFEYYKVDKEYVRENKTNTEDEWWNIKML